MLRRTAWLRPVYCCTAAAAAYGNRAEPGPYRAVMSKFCCTATTTTTIVTPAPRHNSVLTLNGGKSMATGRTPSEVVSPPTHLAVTPETLARIKQRQQTAFDFFDETLQLYGVEQLIFCFNGGKDCTVLLDLLMRYCRQQGISSRDIPMLYIKSDDAFAEIDEFVARCVQHYDVQLIEYEESLKEALTHMSADMPRIKAVFVGSRNTDPYCEHLAPMQPTDNGWPPMMRLNPLLEWSYHDVWHYIHMNCVAYCPLYDRGYTSIGYRSNTVPNPHLKRLDSSDFRPAWELADPTLERAGRVSRKQ
ncbi:blast:FAD synthase [Drosophila guanche]|uniref:FAD synthase n=2 Tax=Drosophila guanche TaxID=7266 RepID=A0A3B0K595_DROGU|nr:blast:FAD synthase [Drosophila guanche]